ncbi:hypothetical protein GUJ93_ZPchr0006g45355 [Zizania palustris]|uniref:Uncharacterized protein n=1 Tax=Zizania palustris TaxID=103762 RepID=A0A8J5SNM9_ZIZPA|nr:hypothetical protein GUJ93_ZPchr0006g45355 [Zizania palustris]
MGTREVYEEKLRSGAHLHRDPTINPGLGSARCPRCLSLLTTNTSGEGDWAITSVLHDATAVAGSGAGAMLSAVHGFNTGIPFVQKHVKGPKWLHLLVGNLVTPWMEMNPSNLKIAAAALVNRQQMRHNHWRGWIGVSRRELADGR